MLRSPSQGRSPITATHGTGAAVRCVLAGGCALVLALPLRARAQSAIQAGTADSASGRVFPFLGARFGAPQRFSVTAGVGVDVGTVAGHPDASQAVLVALAPGLGAERASLTYVYSNGRFGSGVAGSLSALRTVNHPWNAPANATYLGGELTVLPIIAIGPRIGLFRSVSAPTSDKSWLMTLDFGFGF